MQCVQDKHEILHSGLWLSGPRPSGPRPFVQDDKSMLYFMLLALTPPFSGCRTESLRRKCRGGGLRRLYSPVRLEVFAEHPERELPLFVIGEI